MTLIVGLGNKARHGKDTAGEGLWKYCVRRQVELAKYYNKQTALTYDPGPGVYKFADALYRECREIYGMKEKDAKLLQYHGTEVRRAQDEGYWVKQLAAKIIQDRPGIAIITDMRFLNEADYVKRNNGVTINVSRLTRDGKPYVAADRDPNHRSEIELDGFNYDYYIRVKDGDVALVEQQAITILEFELARR